MAREHLPRTMLEAAVPAHTHAVGDYAMGLVNNASEGGIAWVTPGGGEVGAHNMHRFCKLASGKTADYWFSRYQPMRHLCGLCNGVTAGPCMPGSPYVSWGSSAAVDHTVGPWLQVRGACRPPADVVNYDRCGVQVTRSCTQWLLLLPD